VSGDCTELTLNFFFSGVLIGEIFLLKLVLTIELSSSLKLCFFFGDSVLLLNVFISSSYWLFDNEGLFDFFGIDGDSFVLFSIKLDEDIDFIGDDFDGVIFFKFTGEVLSDFNSEFFDGEFSGVTVMQFDLTGDFFGVTAKSLDIESLSCFSILSNSSHSISISCSKGSV
jgi:hypothetical protein